MIFDYRLHVFRTAAKRLSFTKAGEDLFISQPAVTKHIHELERQLNIKLFERSGTRLKLTQAGTILLKHSEQIFKTYRDLEFEINALMEKQSGTLKLGASTTAAQYILPAALVDFRKKFPDIIINLVIKNSDEILALLQRNEIDLGIIEGHTRDSSVKYREFLKDEIVLVANNNNPLAKNASITLEELKEVPLLLREPGSGTLEVIAHALKDAGISVSDLKVEMQFSSSETIKLYMLHSNAMAFLSIHAILKELNNHECSIVDVEDLNITRSFHFVHPHGLPVATAELFMKFVDHFFL